MGLPNLLVVIGATLLSTASSPCVTSQLMAFLPYVLRHTALTRLGERAGGDVFALARIAGHSSITITQRYVHPQADTINRIFTTQIAGRHKIGHSQKTTCGGTAQQQTGQGRKRMIMLELLWCREGESNPQGPKPGGF